MFIYFFLYEQNLYILVRIYVFMPRRRGRCRGQRWITEIPNATYFKPLGIEQINTIYLTFEELEALRLVDYHGLTQEESAIEMGVSRKTLWNDLKSARKKVATALIYSYAIRIEGGNYALRGI